MGAERGLRSGLVAAGVALIATCYGFARFAYGLFAPRFAAEFTLSAGLSGVIAGGGYLGYCVAIGASSLLTARWGPRRVAVLAGTLATAGVTVVATAPSAPVLAAGVLVAGSSTGVASPPLAAAVALWVRAGVRDTAQTVVNAGTGVGVLVSGPVALVLLDDWRLAWGLFAAVTAAVTVWIAVVVPPGGRAAPTAGPRAGRGGRTPGSAALVGAGFALGAASIAVWTSGQDVVRAGGGPGWWAPVAWTVIGAAGIGGAFSGPVVARWGISTSWASLMVLLAAGGTGLALAPGVLPLVLVAGAAFGGAYIALTGVVLVWATRLYPTRPAFGVGLAFLVIAVGQAVGAPLVGLGVEASSLRVVLCAGAVIALAGACVPTPTSPSSRAPPSRRGRTGGGQGSPSAG